jgi:SAM-dependent methyltransferase
MIQLPPRSGRDVADLLPDVCGRVLDVGCNAGALLHSLGRHRPDLDLAGVDIDALALDTARARLPEADLRTAPADALPFADASFDLVTCIDVVEHLPEATRRPAGRELRRVLRPGGRLIVQVPHAGTFAWLDPQNLRHRAPRLYARLVGSGVRDARYAAAEQAVVWHHHFTDQQLRDVLGDSWIVRHTHHGGCFVAPLTEILRWPYFHSWGTSAPGYAALQRLAHADHARDWGRRSYEVLVALDKPL